MPNKYDLDKEAALEDANLFITKMGYIFLEMLQDLTVRQRDFIWKDLEHMPKEEIFSRVMFGFCLADIDGQWLSHLSLNEQLPAINLAIDYRYLFRDCYAYAGGGAEVDSETSSSFYRLVGLFTKLSAANMGQMYIQKKGRLIEDGILEQISPRFAYAVAHFMARYNLATSVQFARIAKDPSKITISPRVIVIIGGVTKGYITQLISKGILPANKEYGAVNIQALPALEWLKSRKNCPPWIWQL